MNSTKQASFELPRYFRFYGFLFFIAGSFFHTIDFLGVENTVIWGMELTFLAPLRCHYYCGPAMQFTEDSGNFWSSNMQCMTNHVFKYLTFC